MTGYRLSSAILLAGVLAVQIANLIAVTSHGNKEFVLNIAAATLLWAAYTVFEWVRGLKVDIYLRAMVVLAILSDGFGGYVLNLYDACPAYDRVQHAFAIYAVALFSYSLAMKTLGNQASGQDPLTPKLRFLFVAALGLAAGALQEVAEFAADAATQPMLLNQPSLIDTDLDLVSNVFGALAAGLHAVYGRFEWNQSPGVRRQR